MRVTQSDIAKLAQVSQATVSRVLAGDERVEPALRERVVAVMRKHNYQPDVRARSLRTRRTGLIGLVLKRPTGGLADDPFFAALTAGIMDFLFGKPFHLCVDVVTDSAAQEGIYDEMLRTRRVDGLILVEAEAKDERIGLLKRDQFPFVLIGNPKDERIPSVDNDNVHAGRVATDHLLKNGYRRVGFLGGPQGLTVSDDRIEGYFEACLAAHRVPQVWRSAFGFEAAREAATAIFEAADRPDALVVLDDFMAFGVILAARQAGLRIPQDLGLVSFNDSSLTRLLDGGLTSVSLGMDQMVQTAVCTLLELIETNDFSEAPRHIIPCELCVRGSSAGPEVKG